MMIPTLETDRLKLIAPNSDCLALYETFYTDADASKMYGGPIGKEQVLARLKSDLGCWYLMGFGVWVIQLKSDDRLVGTCGFWQGIDWPRELTWWVTPGDRGKGIANEASRAVLQHAFNEFKWEKVQTYMNDENAAARALVQKLGAAVSGRMVFPDGLSRTLYDFSAS